MSLVERTSSRTLPQLAGAETTGGSAEPTPTAGEPSANGTVESYDPSFGNHVLAEQALAAGIGWLNQLAGATSPPLSPPPAPSGPVPSAAGASAADGINAVGPSALESYRRDKVASTALASQGLSADEPTQRDDYLKVLAGSGDSPATRQAMLKQSSCALFARGVWRQAGVKHDILENNYRPGRAVSDVVSIAKNNQAWVAGSALKTSTPHKGDVVVLHSDDPECKFPEHVFVLSSEPQVDPKNPNKLHVQVVEGGQGRGGRQIKRHDDVTLEFKNGQWRRGSDARPVLGWADAGKMPVA